VLGWYIESHLGKVKEPIKIEEPIETPSNEEDHDFMIWAVYFVFT
jgi:hypothetical protein